MLLDPARWLAKFMQLTDMAAEFKLFILVLGFGYFLLAFSAERYILPRLAKLVGLLKESVSNTPKRRKGYKVIEAKMRT